MTEADITAADYIVSLWGKRRRQFARLYWLYLTRGTDMPPFSDCYGSTRIASALQKIHEAESIIPLNDNLTPEQHRANAYFEQVVASFKGDMS